MNSSDNILKAIVCIFKNPAVPTLYDHIDYVHLRVEGTWKKPLLKRAC